MLVAWYPRGSVHDTWDHSSIHPYSLVNLHIGLGQTELFLVSHNSLAGNNIQVDKKFFLSPKELFLSYYMLF